jgi:aromatic ring-opening dioxygenase LigB subunit
MLVWACIAPHGGELITELGDGPPERMEQTRNAMRELGRRYRATGAETLVVLTPHGLAVEGHACVSVARTAFGEFAGENGASLSGGFPVDVELAEAIAVAAGELTVSVVRAAYDDERTPIEVFPLDFGALIPLYFLCDGAPSPRVVVVCPARDMPRRQLVDFGRAVVDAATSIGRRIAIVCSADQGHGHDAAGPYGLSPHSPGYDRAYCRAIRDGDLGRLLSWRNDWIDAALPDSYWQTLMLYGALAVAPMRSMLLSYEAPTYFGMVCAEFSGEMPSPRKDDVRELPTVILSSKAKNTHR